MKPFKIAVIVVLTIVLFYIFFFWLTPFLLNKIEIESLGKQVPMIEILILGVILGPIFETIVFLTLPFYSWTNKTFRYTKNLLFIFAISVGTFALSHTYSLEYIGLAGVSGIYFFLAFLTFYHISDGLHLAKAESWLETNLKLKRHNLSNLIIATLCVWSIHFLNNLFAFYLDFRA